jgi:hypothetical protein
MDLVQRLEKISMIPQNPAIVHQIVPVEFSGVYGSTEVLGTQDS